LYEGIGADTSAGYNNNSTTTNNKNSTRSDQILDEITRLLIVAADVPDGDDDDPVPEAFHIFGVLCEYGHIGWDQLILYGMNTQYSRFKSILLSHPKSHYALAVDLYHRAVELDYAESMYHLGLMYAYGRGVQLNYGKAVEYFRQAALEHYHAASMRYLALFAFKGYGAPEDEIDFDMAQYFFRQCIAWSNYSAISLKGDGHNEENWIRQICTTELEEATKWFNKSQQLRIELQKNWSIVAGNMI
jgi:tetratricopeptide (TPR) repeat protein